MNQTVTIDLGDRSYHIYIGRGLVGECGAAVREVISGGKLLLAYDEAVAAIAKHIEDSLAVAGFTVVPAPIPSGEQSKCTEQLDALWNRMAEADFTRDCGLVAVGGGVVGDLAGFAAASFLRGIPFVQVPTSLLAMVDSSVGGKTGINLAAGKNLVGAFWQPRLVLVDLECLHTLPVAERNSGLAEVIKYGVIRDADFFAFLEKNLTLLFNPAEDERLATAVRRSVQIKADVVRADEREGGLRRILNFGHTIGHAVEAEGGYSALRHGEAIAIGMVAASLLTLKRNVPGWTKIEHERLSRLIGMAHLPVHMPESMSAQALLDRTRVDKKAAGGRVRYVLPTRLGHVETVSDVTDEMVLEVCRELGAAP